MAAMFLTLHILIQTALIVRVLLRPHREPASRISWLVVIIAAQVLGMVAYILFGEVNIGRRRIARLPDVAAAGGADAKNLRLMGRSV